MDALIVDDEPVARAVLREELAQIPGVQVAGEAETGAAALRQIEDLRPDLVLLDIQMPGLDGFQVLERISGRLPAIIFVTAFDQHALRAFEAGAVDYLLKPVRAERLREAVERAARSRASGKQDAERVERLLHAASGASRKLVGRWGEEYFLLNLDEVLALQAEGELVWIHTAQRRYLAAHSLQALEARLAGTAFQRIHRGALISINHVKKLSALSSNRWQVTLSNGKELVVSKRQSQRIRQLLRA